MWVTLLLASVALAGCASDEPEANPAVPAGADIFGLVLDSDGERLAGALVALPDLDMEWLTLEDGEYAFDVGDVVGDILVVAEKDGHQPVRAVVTLSEFLAAQVVFRLYRWEEIPPQHTTLQYEGLLACEAHVAEAQQDCPGLGESSRDFVLPLRHDGARPNDLRLEVFWDESLLSADRLSLQLDGTAGGQSFQVANGDIVRLGEALGGVFATDAEVAMGVRAATGDVPATLALAQRFTVLATLEMPQPGPDNS